MMEISGLLIVDMSPEHRSLLMRGGAWHELFFRTWRLDFVLLMEEGIYFCCVRIKGYSSFTTFAENNARNNIMTTSSALSQMD